jgi:hypothetical protein
VGLLWSDGVGLDLFVKGLGASPCGVAYTPTVTGWAKSRPCAAPIRAMARQQSRDLARMGFGTGLKMDLGVLREDRQVIRQVPKARLMWRTAGNAAAVPCATAINASGAATIVQTMQRRIVHMLRQSQESVRLARRDCGSLLRA